VFSERGRGSLVEENPHSGNFERTGGVFEDGTSLFEPNPREPLQELRELGAILDILEQSDHRDAGAPKHPSPAYALGMSFNGRA
jgi:hypothetical protein